MAGVIAALFLLLAVMFPQRITHHTRRPHFPLPLLPLSQFPPHFPVSPIVLGANQLPQTFTKVEDNNPVNDNASPAEEDENYSDVYHSPESFRSNYAEMEKKFKVYLYPDGDLNTFYQTPWKVTGKYVSEGYFFQNIRESRFRTLDPEEADLFFVPVSPHKMCGKGTSYENMTVIVQTYVDGLIAKYPYWNKTLGADNFFVTCHDVCVRVVCSPSYNVGFIPHKDVALPQVLQPFALPVGGNDVENRVFLYTLLLLVSNASAGSVIGKGGSTITDVQAKSGARIQLSRNQEFFPGTTDRIIMILGSIKELHAEEGIDVEPRRRLRLVVPNSSCGGIISKRGDTIKSFIEESKAGIKISPRIIPSMA